jgi:putative Mn2+ efflux pump MntP
MNNFEIVILALALVFNSWATYLNAGTAFSKEIISQKVYYSGIMFFFQFVMAGVGIWAGCKIGSFEIRVNILVSFSILLISGLIVLLTSIRTTVDERTTEYTDNKVLLFAAIAEGIIPLITGTAIGILSLQPYLHWLVIGVFLAAGILMGHILANRKGTETSKPRFGSISGLLILAAAIKLILNLTSFEF